MKKQGKCLTFFQRKLLEKSLQTKDLRPEYQRRINIMLLADEGFSKVEISKALKCTTETARYWSGQAKAGKAHHWQNCPIGRPKTINEKYLARLKQLATANPRDLGYSFERWTGQWLSKQLNKELGIEISSVHVNRLLKQMGLSSRPKSLDDNSPFTDSSTKKHRLELRNLSSVSTPVSTQNWQLNF